MKLNLGCGTDIKNGYVNLDIMPGKEVDVVHDVNKFPYPFPKNHFDEIYASHILEHVDDVMKVMAEIYRILKPNGTIEVKVPYYSSAGAFQDITHKHFFAEDTIKYYLVQNAYKGKFKYELVKQTLAYTKPFKYLPFRSILKSVLLNVVSEMTFKLR